MAVHSPLPSPFQVKTFCRKIISWFDENARDFPWRKTDDPFRVLIAEIMLRRTKPEQVKPVYKRLLNEFPDAESLSRAPEDRVREIVRSLGLEWRAPTFTTIAREVKEKYMGEVPRKREELLKLSGVGDYVAGAVLSLAYGKKEWIVDINVVRVFKRYFGIQTSKEGRRDKAVIELAKMYVSGKDPRKANLAILDFAAIACTAKNPKHEECPVRDTCAYVGGGPRARSQG